MNKQDVIKTISINGKEYVEKDSISQQVVNTDGMKYVICRTYSAGVFAGYLAEINGQVVRLLEARRLWKWDGAASLSELATMGTRKPNECKFPCVVPEVTLLQAIEIIPVTLEAKKSIGDVKIWTA